MGPVMLPQILAVCLSPLAFMSVHLIILFACPSLNVSCDTLQWKEEMSTVAECDKGENASSVSLQHPPRSVR